MKTSIKSMPESAEILRLALPLMSKYKIPVTPRNYAVWYEYAAGSNKYLNDKIDNLISSGAPMNSGVISSLYAEFIDSDYELNQLEKAQKIFADLHSNIIGALDTAFGDTSEYGDTLDKFQNKIKADINMEQLDFLIRDMANSTSNMIASNRHLMQDLATTRSEVQILKEQLQEAKQQAKTDTLTELANRKAFFDLLEEMEKSGELHSGTHSLFMLDIDNFKAVNDKYGHLLGDKVIKAVAQVLKKHTKGKDFPARIGGEEFIVLLPDTNITGAMVAADNIRRTIESARIVNPRNKQEISQVTVSIGVTEFMPNDDIESVIARADKALYGAKNDGRNKTKNAAELPLPGSEMQNAAMANFY